MEDAVYLLLVKREEDGEISDLCRQATVVLQDGPRNVRITWRVDFSYTLVETGVEEFCEAKGFETDVYKLKLKLFRKDPPGRLEIWKGHFKKPFLAEVIV